MNPETWRRIDQILDRIFDADEADRGSILDEECGDDEALRRQVESLLAAESRTGVLDSDLSDEPSLFAKALGKATDDLTMTSMERRFGPYRVVRMLGAGGMGVVYEGWDTRLERPVAIKVLPHGVSGEVSQTGAEAEERFLREARAASALDHANICSIYDIGVAEEGSLDEGRTFLVMALYRGETLRERIERGPLELDDAVDLARQIGRGLARAHEAGIVHRDVKPANVFVTEHGEAKILDFGLAKVIDEAGLTRTGEVLGTPAYMSPEQLLGQEVDARADIWAFGVLLYRMIGGVRPFPTQSVASLNAVLSRDPEPLLTHRPDAPPELAQLVERCLAKDPERRPQSMREILDVLGDTPTATTRWTQTVQPPDRSKRRLLWAASAIVVMILAAVAWRLWDRSATPEVRSSETAGSTAPADSAPAEATESEPTGLVVLPFNGLNPDPDVAGLGRVITEMLVTDLRGSPDLAVASTSSVHRALEAVGWSDDEPPSPQTMRELAEEVGRDTVLHGSYTRLGDRYRILATLERMADESVLMSKQVESTEAGLFNAVDELSLAVREALRARSAGSESIKAVTTSSLEAMAAYTTGLMLSYDRQDEEAIAALEQALEIDPLFALAWRRLGLIEDNMGQQARAHEHLARAFELSDRLPPKQRVPVRADHFANAWSTLEQTLEVYEEGLVLYPGMTSWRNNLGYTYGLVERYAEASEQFEKSISLGTTFGYAWVNLGLVQTGMGETDQAVDTVSSYANLHPGESAWQSAMGWQLALTGDLGTALQKLRHASTLIADPDPEIKWNLWRVYALQENWESASQVAATLLEMKDPEGRRKGRIGHALALIFHGESKAALKILDGPRLSTNWSEYRRQVLRMELYLAQGRPEQALGLSSDLRQADPDGWFGRRATGLAVAALESLSRPGEANEMLAKLESKHSNQVDLRHMHHTAGKLALMRSQHRQALEELTAAEALLPIRGITFGMVEPPHADLWLDLGRAYFEVGDLQNARKVFSRAELAGAERLSYPRSWTNSIFWLAQIDLLESDRESANERMERFLRYRSDGDLDFDMVETASQTIIGK